MEKENAERIWHGLDLAAQFVSSSLGSESERRTLTEMRIWLGLHLAAQLLGLSLGSV